MTTKLQLIIGVLMLMCFSPLQAEVQVSIDRNPVQVNESFQLVFSLDSSPDSEPDFTPLQQHFMLLDTSQSNSISIINGEYQRSVSYTLQLMPKQIGDYMIPAVRFGKERSKPFEVSVKPASIAALPQDQLVLELQAQTADVYVQGQVIVTLRLLSSENISAYQMGDLELENSDAVIEPLGDVKQFQTRIVDKSYLVLEKRYALYPQQAGRLAVQPVMAEVRLPSKSGFDPFQRGGEIRRIRSQKLFIDVIPVPAEFQAQEWLPANNIELHEEWQGDLNQIRAGEPLTRTLTLVADGLTAAQLPALTLPQVDGIKQYPDKPALQDQRSDNGIVATRQQKVAMIAGAAGSYQLPEISLQWWNLKTGKLQTARIAARELRVVPAPVSSLANPPAAAELVSTRVVVETNQFWVWLSLLLACGWGISVLIWWMKTYRGAAVVDSPVEEQMPSLHQARRALQQACESNDAAGARLALLVWGRALLAPTPIRQLAQLGQQFGEELARQIDLINQSLYAKPTAAWQGADLWRLCQSLEKNLHHIVRKRETGGLLPLNPAA